MEVIRFDSEMYSGVLCPISGIEIVFQDDNITDYIEDTFVVGVLLSIQPEECAIGGELNDLWMQFYSENSDAMDLEEMISNFPGPYRATEVNSQGMGLRTSARHSLLHCPQRQLHQIHPKKKKVSSQPNTHTSYPVSRLRRSPAYRTLQSGRLLLQGPCS